jgi:hypothetical protein
VLATPAAATWRFALPAGSAGPFEQRLFGSGPRILRHALGVEVRRGGAGAVLDPVIVSGRSIRFDVPGLAPARGDLFVTLRPPAGLVFEARPPSLVVGEQPLGRAGLPLPLAPMRRLGIGLLAVLAAACAFRFETACLAGVLALALELPRHGPRLGVAVVGLLVVALLGTALTRRAALP